MNIFDIRLNFESNLSISSLLFLYFAFYYFFEVLYFIIFLDFVFYYFFVSFCNVIFTFLSSIGINFPPFRKLQSIEY